MLSLSLGQGSPNGNNAVQVRLIKPRAVPPFVVLQAKIGGICFDEKQIMIQTPVPKTGVWKNFFRNFLYFIGFHIENKVSHAYSPKVRVTIRPSTPIACSGNRLTPGN